MNRSEVAEIQKALCETTVFSDCKTIYKSLRPKQVVNSELRITKVVNVVEKQYINAFGLDVDKDNIVNISSGIC